MFRDFEEPAVLFETAGFLLFGVFGAVSSELVVLGARLGLLHVRLEQESQNAQGTAAADPAADP
jgi:hypothetical protein